MTVPVITPARRTETSSIRTKIRSQPVPTSEAVKSGQDVHAIDDGIDRKQCARKEGEDGVDEGRDDDKVSQDGGVILRADGLDIRRRTLEPYGCESNHFNTRRVHVPYQ